MTALSPQVTVNKIGQIGAPLVIIDDFSGRATDLLRAGYEADYEEPGAGYPGVRAWHPPDYLDIRRDLMMQIVGRVFGLTQSIRCEMSCFSLVTTPPTDLVPLQRIPHYDRSSNGKVIGIMHYLLGKESGGTAFYRHRRTGLELISDEMIPAYERAIEEDNAELGLPPKQYCYGDSDRYELIGEVESRPDRLILYPGRMLHSGVISQPDALSSDPRKGRLTINMFLVGE